MTTLTRESIAALSGRELDAAVHKAMRGDRVEKHPVGWLYFTGLDHSRVAGGWEYVPQHSHADCRGLAEMIAAARERGWDYLIYNEAKFVVVELDDCGQRDVNGAGSTLPEAFARALLLTTLEATP